MTEVLTEWLGLGTAFKDVAAWLLASVAGGTVVALLTAMLLSTVLRKARPALKGALWVVVLVKFLVPLGPGVPGSAASLLPHVDHWTASSAKPQTATAGESQPQVFDVGLWVPQFVPEQAAVSATAAPARRWRIAEGLLAVYVLIVSLIAGRRVQSYLAFARSCRRLPHADAATREVVFEVCGRLGIRPVREVRISESAPAPFILGLFRPVLVLSPRQLSEALELEAVVLHEVAHLRRGDLYVRALQCLAGTLLFFWPVVAWVNRRLDLIREQACDEWALRHGRLSRGAYARCLLRALSPVPVRQFGWRPATMASSLNSVERRIEMIMQRPGQAAVSRAAKAGAAAAVCAWAAFVLGGAQARPIEEEKQKQVRVQVTRNAEGDEIEVEDVVVDGQRKQWVRQNGEVIHFQEFEAGEGDVWFVPEMEGLGADGLLQLHLLADDGTGAKPRIMMLHGGGLGVPMVPPGFAEAHPEADADGDGKVSHTEYSAYHVAIMLSQPEVVLEKFPRADRNQDGVLDAAEAARLVSHPGMPHGIGMHAGPMMGGGAWMGAPARMAYRVHSKDGNGLDGEHTIEIELQTDGEPVEGVEIEADDIEVQTEISDGEENVVIVKPQVRAAIRATPGNEEQVVVIAPEEGDKVEAAAAAGVPLPSGWQGFNEVIRKRMPSPADWARENIPFQPTANDVAVYIRTVEQTEAEQFLQQYPDADVDSDGKITEEERRAAIERQRKAAAERIKAQHERLYKEHPEWDKDKNGSLSREEVRAGLMGDNAPKQTASPPQTVGPQTLEVRETADAPVEVIKVAAPKKN